MEACPRASGSRSPPLPPWGSQVRLGGSGSQSPPPWRLQAPPTTHRSRASLPQSNQSVQPSPSTLCFFPQSGAQIVTAPPATSVTPLRARVGSLSPPAPCWPASSSSDPALRGIPAAPARSPPGNSPGASQRRSPTQPGSEPLLPTTITAVQGQNSSIVRVEGGTVHRPQCSWAYLSDTEILNLAEQALCGLVAPGLLRRLNRRDLVALLAAQLGSDGSTAPAVRVASVNEQTVTRPPCYATVAVDAAKSPLWPVQERVGGDTSRQATAPGHAAQAISLEVLRQVPRQISRQASRSGSRSSSPTLVSRGRCASRNAAAGGASAEPSPRSPALVAGGGAAAPAGVDRQDVVEAAQPQLQLQPQPHLKLVAYPPSGHSSPALTTRAILPNSGTTPAPDGGRDSGVQNSGLPNSAAQLNSTARLLPPQLPSPGSSVAVHPTAPLMVRRRVNSRSSWPPQRPGAVVAANGLVGSPTATSSTVGAVPADEVTSARQQGSQFDETGAIGSAASLARRAKLAADSCSALQRTESALQLTRALARSASTEQMQQVQQMQRRRVDAARSLSPLSSGRQMDPSMNTKLVAPNCEPHVAQSPAARITAANREFAVAQGVVATVAAPNVAVTVQVPGAVQGFPARSSSGSPTPRMTMVPVTGLPLPIRTPALSGSPTPRLNSAPSASALPSSLPTPRSGEPLYDALAQNGVTSCVLWGTVPLQTSSLNPSGLMAEAWVDTMQEERDRMMGRCNDCSNQCDADAQESQIRNISRSASMEKAVQKDLPRSARNASRGSSRGRRKTSRPSRTVKAQEFDNPEAAALHLMKLADSHSRNGSLTVTEMQTFLRGTPHEDFMRWVTKTKQWLAFDSNRSGTMEIEDLRAALREFYAAKSRGDLEVASKQGSVSPMSSRPTSPARSLSPKSDSGRRSTFEELDTSRKQPPVQDIKDTAGPTEPRWSIAEVRAELADAKSKTSETQCTEGKSNYEAERAKLHGALRHIREQDYDELLAAKTREIEALQRRTEEKMARLGQVRQPSRSRELTEPSRPTAGEADLASKARSRVELGPPMAQQVASTATELGAARLLDFNEVGPASTSPSLAPHERRLNGGSSTPGASSRRRNATDGAIGNASKETAMPGTNTPPAWRPWGGTSQRNRRVTM